MLLHRQEGNRDRRFLNLLEVSIFKNVEKRDPSYAEICARFKHHTLADQYNMLLTQNAIMHKKLIEHQQTIAFMNSWNRHLQANLCKLKQDKHTDVAAKVDPRDWDSEYV